MALIVAAGDKGRRGISEICDGGPRVTARVFSVVAKGWLGKRIKLKLMKGKRSYS